MADERTWFEVQSRIKVLAADEDDAINRAAGVLRGGYKSVPDVYPVGTFDARPCESPLQRPVERQTGPS